ncbi:MAG TPA: DinB family protein [Vicinamibacterales bacterium]|nr:DinB family protein [Vicinamibacterales bacterium]
MTVRDALLAEYDHEMGTTRRLLERLPEGALGWRPHPRSYSLGELASHLAQIPMWAARIAAHTEFDLGGGPPTRPTPATSRQEVLEQFDRHVADARAQLAGRSDTELALPWTLRRSGQVFLTLPRLAALRSFVLNHSIHHRGQLSVYLRLNDVPVPAIYGPSADEGL